MDDRVVIDGFVADGVVQAFGSRLNVDSDCLLFDGWWPAAFRVGPTTFALRHDEPPEETTLIDEIAARLGAQGLSDVPANAMLMVAITYTAIDLGLVDWTIWSTDLATAEGDLATRAGIDAFFGDASPRGIRDTDFSAGIGGFRRLAGLAPLVILAVGVDEAAVEVMGSVLGNCHFECRALGEIAPEACGSLTPNLALVNAMSEEGRGFVIDLRATPAGRLLPVVAVSQMAAMAADVTLDPAEDPQLWAEHIRSLLP